MLQIFLGDYLFDAANTHHVHPVITSLENKRTTSGTRGSGKAVR